MFQNLQTVQMTSLDGEDREAFALTYLRQRVYEKLTPSLKGKVIVNTLDVPLGEGDTRQLVRYLRMLTFYIHCLVMRSDSSGRAGAVDVSLSLDAMTNITTVALSCGESMQLRSGTYCGNIYALIPFSLDSRAPAIVKQLQKLHPDIRNPSELCQILDFYFAKTLAPVVVLSQNQQIIDDLISLLARLQGIHGIANIDPSSYKIMKSLYDSSDTPNLRNDIINIISADPKAFVAIQLNCNTIDSQMQVREIVEDTPSMTAFSTERSALHKDGLLFGIFVDGTVTPEIKSRASLVI
jgi:hypothetical protein